MTQPRDPSAHVSDERLAAFVDGRLTPIERADAVAHFSTCSDCRRAMIATRKLVAREPARPGWHRGVPLLIAATLVVAIAPQLMRDTRPTADVVPDGVSSPQRAIQPEVQRLIDVIAPKDRARVQEASVVLRWHAVGSDATYRVIVQDSVGAPVWATTIGDTVATVPASARLVAGTQYFWSVDAQLADGRTARSGVRRFGAP